MLTCGSLFSGAGLLDYGLHLAGLQHSWFVEAVPFRRRLLAQRFPGCEVHDDVRTFDALRAARVDVIAGGFPCKGASTAGQRTGLAHPETALWREYARIVGDARPRYVVVENVANILALHDGAIWATVLRDLAALGYDAWWDCLPAAAFGAPHLRDRVFLVAVADTARQRREPRAPDDAARNDERALAGRGALRPAPDDPSIGRRPRDAGRAPIRGPEPEDGARPGRPTADADGDGLRHEPEPQPERRGAAQPGRRAAPPADDHRDGRQEQPLVDRPEPARGSEHGGRRGGMGAAFPWGRFEPAIRRWEAIHGPAPQPFVPRVADGRPRGVDGPRIAALGDGVLVHAGRYIGELVMALEETSRDA